MKVEHYTQVPLGVSAGTTGRDMEKRGTRRTRDKAGTEPGKLSGLTARSVSVCVPFGQHLGMDSGIERARQVLSHCLILPTMLLISYNTQLSIC